MDLEQAAGILQRVFREQREYWLKHSTVPADPLYLLVHAPVDDADDRPARGLLHAGGDLRGLVRGLAEDEPAHGAVRNPRKPPARPQATVSIELGSQIAWAFERLTLALAAPAM
jgi:hypothetical protein